MECSDPLCAAFVIRNDFSGPASTPLISHGNDESSIIYAKINSNMVSVTQAQTLAELHGLVITLICGTASSAPLTTSALPPHKLRWSHSVDAELSFAPASDSRH